MIPNLLMVVVVGVGVFSLAAMSIIAVANSYLAASSSSIGPRFDRHKHRQRMEQLADSNLSAVMPSVIGLYGAVIVCGVAFGERLEAWSGGSVALPTVLLVVVPAGFFLFLGWLTAARCADDRKREFEEL